MIVAIDFDGILCKNDFPAIGEPNYEMISKVRQLIDIGCEVILWTSRTDERLIEAVEWCEDYGLHFCAVNENAPSNIEQYKDLYPNGTRKVYADYYIDDHNIEFQDMMYNCSISGILHEISRKIDTIIRRCRYDDKR